MHLKKEERILVCIRQITQFIKTQEKDFNKISPISGCMAAITRPKEAAGFIQICVYVCFGVGGGSDGGSHTQARGWEEGLL